MSKESVEQKRKYKEPNDPLFVEFKEHLYRLKHEFHPRYSVEEQKNRTKDEFEFIKCINSKSNVLAKDKTFGKYVSVKVIPKTVLITSQRIKQTKVEKRIAKAIRFPFLAHMEFTLKDNSNIYFVHSYNTSEDLFTLLQRLEKIKERDAKFYGAQILLALEYLHNIDIIHRNIKPENIIFMPNGYVKLSDFRFAKPINLRTYSFCGTPEYMAPEIILNKGYGKWVDWWAYGVLLYELIAGITPFASSEPFKTCENILEGAEITFTKYFSKDCRNLIQNILQRDLSKRYGILLNESLDIKCHTWFEVMDWQKVYSQTLNAPYTPETNMPYDEAKKTTLKIPISTDVISEDYEKEFEGF